MAERYEPEIESDTSDSELDVDLTSTGGKLAAAKCLTCKTDFYVSRQHKDWFGVTTGYTCKWCSVDKPKYDLRVEETRLKKQITDSESAARIQEAQAAKERAQIEADRDKDVIAATREIEAAKAEQEKQKTAQQREMTKQAQEITEQEREKTKQAQEITKQEKHKTRQMELKEAGAESSVDVNEVIAMLQRIQPDAQSAQHSPHSQPVMGPGVHESRLYNRNRIVSNISS